MKRVLFAATVLMGLLAVTADVNAQCPNCPSGGLPPYGAMPQFGGGLPPYIPQAQGGGTQTEKYGLAPCLRKLCFWKKSDSAAEAQARARRLQHAPVAQSGTLVFPHHPFFRSPRDFFMED
jgi:hypothetical protein